MTSAQDLMQTGVPGLDAVLGGGVRPGTLALLIGSPGAGKTVLASQMIFQAARRGQQTLIFTTYSESLEQYLEHMRAFAFFDAQLVGSLVQVFTLPSLLGTSDEAPGTLISRTIREVGAQLVLIDGFQGIDELLPEDQSARTLLSTLAIQVRYLRATLLLTFAGNARDSVLYSELTASDLALGLVYTLDGRRHTRRLDVVKQRGRAQLPGLHSYAIEADGVHIFPRIEVFPPPQQQLRVIGRAQFGLAELDSLLGGGLNVGSTTLIAGAPGTGKTTLGLHWVLADARPDATSVFLTFGEYPEQLVEKAAAFGIDGTAALKSGELQIIRISPVDLNPDAVAQQLLDVIKDGRVRRVVIDDASVLIEELGSRTRDYIGAINAIAYGQNISMLLLYEIAAFQGLGVDGTAAPFAGLSDTAIVIQQYEIAGELRRLLAVLQMRFSSYDRTLREVVLGNGRVRVLPPQESVRGVLEAGASLSGGVAPLRPTETREQN